MPNIPATTNEHMKTISNTIAVLLFMGLTSTGSAWAQLQGDKESTVNGREEEDGFWSYIQKYIHRHSSNDDQVELDDEVLYSAINFSEQWKFQIGDNDKWSQPDYDDAGWEDIRVPSDWENDGFNGYDGYAWYRTHFDGRKLQKGQASYLMLGFIDDVDETYLNGVLVGKSGKFPPRFRTAFNSNRKYYLNEEFINFEGDNVVSVKVYDEYKNGGIVKGKQGIYVSEVSRSLVQNLYGAWKFTPGNKKSYANIDYRDDDWDILLVPSPWDNQGYRSLDGMAWYRKQFQLTFQPKEDENYFLVLGKIDDFDVTYFNGEEIGSTNDNKRFNASSSYRAIRVYKIPNGLLKEQGQNVIAVQVQDIGKEGGIYAGPVGIVSEEDVTRIIRSAKY